LERNKGYTHRLLDMMASAPDLWAVDCPTRLGT